MTDPKLVARMTKYYGTIEEARNGYREVAKEVKAHNETETIKHGGKVIWVTDSGRITAQYATTIEGTIDAWNCLPIK